MKTTREERDVIRAIGERWQWDDELETHVPWQDIRNLLDDADEAERLREGIRQLLLLDTEAQLRNASRACLVVAESIAALLKGGRGMSPDEAEKRVEIEPCPRCGEPCRLLQLRCDRVFVSCTAPKFEFRGEGGLQVEILYGCGYVSDQVRHPLDCIERHNQRAREIRDAALLKGGE